MASSDPKSKAVSLGLLPPGSENGAPGSVDVKQEEPLTSDTELPTKRESVVVEQEKPSTSDTKFPTKPESVDVEQEKPSTSDTEISTERVSVDVEKEEPSTSVTKPTTQKENMLPKPMKAKAANPNPEVFSNLVASMQTVVPSAVAPIGDQNGMGQSQTEGS